MQYFRLAIKLAGNDTEIGDLNLLRYYLCHLLHVEKSYYDAIVIGNFLARHYPDSPNAKQCARIALASLVELNSAAAGEDHDSKDKDFEEEQIGALADYMVKKWPGQPESDEALGTLIPLLVKGNKLRQAQAYVAKIPAQSAQRGMAELTIGQALWSNYLNAMKQVRDWENGTQPVPAETDLAAKKRELETLKAQARQTLVDGVERMRKGGEVNKVLAAAVLSLAQIYVDTDAAGRAISLIEDPKIGVLTLVNKNDPAARDDAIVEETYKTALRAYISSLATAGTSARATIDKARGVMTSLKRRIATSPEGQQRLVSIYVSLARDLSRQMEIADAGVKKTLGEGFETFLKEVAADASELSILIWVGDTYLGMGEAFGGSAKSLTPQAKGYFVRASETYQKVLDKSKADEGKVDASSLPALAATGVRVKLAKAKKSLGEYAASRDLFEAVLKENPTFLPAQMEAARLYQDWGAAGSEDRDNYVRAMIGALPDKSKNGKNTIWGWGEIARATANNPQFREQFYDARYNLALCRYSFAIAQDDANRKADQLKLAKNDIGLTAGLYPELGGEEKKKQYDNLLKSIQQALGEPAEGLKGMSSPQKKR
jgi:tetratricopeptide (TPR) repeat protein